MTAPTLTVASVASVAAVARAGLGGGLVPEDVSPGVIGFLVTLALVLACIPLFRSMTGKLRGVQHRALPEEAAHNAPGDDGRADSARLEKTPDDDAAASLEGNAGDAAPGDHPRRRAPVTPAEDDRSGPAEG